MHIVLPLSGSVTAAGRKKGRQAGRPTLRWNPNTGTRCDPLCSNSSSWIQLQNQTTLSHLRKQFPKAQTRSQKCMWRKCCFLPDLGRIHHHAVFSPDCPWITKALNRITFYTENSWDWMDKNPPDSANWEQADGKWLVYALWSTSAMPSISLQPASRGAAPFLQDGFVL